MYYRNGLKHFKMVCLIAVSLIGICNLGGCAFDLANIKPTPTEIVRCKNDCVSFTVSEEIVLDNVFCRYDRTIEKGSKWVHIGDIPEGPVYKPMNTFLTIECSNVFEGYLVLNNKSIKGFYLPVEKGYVPIKKPVILLTQ